MNEVYRQLAAHLDNLPVGYPATASGVELRILQRLFTPEEAAVATGLTMMPEPVADIAARIGRNETELAPLLAEMSRKGLIFRLSKDGRHSYSAAQFVIGIWEYHLNDLDPELIRDVNEYLPVLMEKSWMTVPTKQLRVVPVARSVDAKMQTMPYEAAEQIIKSQSKIVVSPCICRKEHDMVGKGCGKPMEVCLAFGSGAFYYEQNGLGRSITQDQALEILKIGQDAGLVLQPGNARRPTNICMCCGCCCQILKNLNKLDRPALAVHTNYYAELDAAACIACEACVGRCQMNAITVEGTALDNADRCIGCGRCVTDCPTGAITLMQKPEDQRYIPPANVMETYINIARERGKI